MEDMKLTYVLLQLNEELPEIVDGRTTGKTVRVASNLKGYVDLNEMRRFDEVFIYTKEGEFCARKPSAHIMNIQVLREDDTKPDLKLVEPEPEEKPAPAKSPKGRTTKGAARGKS